MQGALVTLQGGKCLWGIEGVDYIYVTIMITHLDNMSGLPQGEGRGKKQCHVPFRVGSDRVVGRSLENTFHNRVGGGATDCCRQ